MKRFAWVAAIIAGASSAQAAPPNAAVDRCAQAAEDGQRLRDDSKLRGARDKFLECGAESCPVVVRRDCNRWKLEIDAAIPTLVVRAVDSRGRDVSGVKVVLDGATTSERVDGKNVPVDPGEHTVSIVAKDGTKVDQAIVVLRSERDRVVTLAFDRALDPEGAPLLTAALAPTPAPVKSYALPIFLGGAAVLSLGVFTLFDLTAWGHYRDQEDGCGKTPAGCSKSDDDTIRTQFRVAGVSLAAGVVLGAVAGYFFAFPPEKTPVSVAFTGNGIRGSF